MWRILKRVGGLEEVGNSNIMVNWGDIGVKQSPVHLRNMKTFGEAAVAKCTIVTHLKGPYADSRPNVINHTVLCHCMLRCTRGNRLCLERVALQLLRKISFIEN